MVWWFTWQIEFLASTLVFGCYGWSSIWEIIEQSIPADADGRRNKARFALAQLATEQVRIFHNHV
jgi:hypothetical protein